MRNRDNFTAKTIELLGKRVGYHCSNPDCCAETMGPGANPCSTLNLGEAAHICAASPGGPRYDPTMSCAERKSIDNGIWLCKYCARIIDLEPSEYPVELLKQWKQEAETKQRNCVVQKAANELMSNQRKNGELTLYQKPDHSDGVFGFRAKHFSPYRTYQGSGLYCGFISETISLSAQEDYLEKILKRPDHTTDSYIYSDSSIIPICAVRVEEYTINDVRHYEIISDSFRIALILNSGNSFTGIRFEVCVEDGNTLKRLDSFNCIFRIIENDSLWTKNHKNERIVIRANANAWKSQWNAIKDRLTLYIECLKKLLEIELFYGIVFSLPPKFSEEDLYSLSTLSDSISQQSCITLQGIPWSEDEGFVIANHQEIPFTSPITNDIYLFGFVFRPNGYYFPAGRYWKNNRQLLVNHPDGLKICCAFDCKQTINSSMP